MMYIIVYFDRGAWEVLFKFLWRQIGDLYNIFRCSWLGNCASTHIFRQIVFISNDPVNRCISHIFDDKFSLIRINFTCIVLFLQFTTLLICVGCKKCTINIKYNCSYFSWLFSRCQNIFWFFLLFPLPLNCIVLFHVANFDVSISFVGVSIC